MKQHTNIVLNKANAPFWFKTSFSNACFKTHAGSRMNSPVQKSLPMNHIPIHKILSRIVLTTSMLLMGIFMLQAQDSLVVTGTIISPEFEPVPNVSVSVEGSREMPAFTNEAGEFSITAPSGKVWIGIAPAANFKRTRVFLNDRTKISIMVTPNDIISGDDEILILRQVEKVKNLPTTFSNLELSNIKNAIIPSIDKYMQGRMAGVHVVNQSGTPGSGALTLIRGINSLNATNQPLYLIDGIIIESQGLFGSLIDGFSYNPLLAVNPFDISNATVLKDGVFAAAYGSKASNGVVMISTLDPSSTETSFEIDYRQGLSLKPQHYLSQLNAQQHKTLANEVIYSSGMLEEDLVEIYPNLFV